ncbi:TetR/AcrR family transcriptional regulator [Spongiibacter sp. KMU-158]|uniref:TetR/AcrR family transcriptional regulator n=1 Tax=Spongiibacter pelagi TaxID=2760804 RepID=A0A927C3V6_9GAMM|nr:TetR/AcrR family transcriptional regulator [Spongiibacter pelagi]
MREVVKYSQTPRGSVQHHFPGGKQQLIEDAMLASKDIVSQMLSAVVTEQGAKSGLQGFIDYWIHTLSQNEFEVGCPILAVTVEQYISEDGTPNTPVQDRFLDIAKTAFEEWQAQVDDAGDYELIKV